MSAARCWSSGRYWWRVTRYSRREDRDGRGAVQLGERADVVAEEHVLEPLDVVLLERPRDLDRRRQAPEPVAVDHDPHPRPDGLADPAHRLEAPLELVGRDEQAIARDPEVVERPELHRRDALFEQLVRERLGLVVPAPQVLEDARRAVDVVRRPTVRRAAAGVVDRQPVPNAPAQQLEDRLARRPGRGGPRARRRSPRSRGPRSPCPPKRAASWSNRFDQWRWICPASLPSSFGAARWWM